MVSPEKKDTFIFSKRGGPKFEPQISYEEIERAPRMIIRQTNALLTLFNQGAIRNPDLANDYLGGYTMFFLRQAEEGAVNLYNQHGMLFEDLKPEIKEVAGYTFIVFASLRDQLTSPFLPNGFSKKGMLKGPGTRKEFLKRLEELKLGVWRVASGLVEPRTTPETDPSLLRTFGFFRVGSNLPVKLTEDKNQREKREKEKFEDILKGIDV